MSFEELQIGMSTPIEIVGEVVAGEAAQTLKEVKALIKGLSSNTFDLFELLYKVKAKKYYQPKHDTFSEYIKTLDMKVSKVYYGVKIVEVMGAVGVPRAQYEEIGVAKLRAITRLELTDEDGAPKMYGDLTAVDTVKKLLTDSTQQTPEEVDEAVKELQGLMGDEALVWLNFPIKKAARDVWEKAVSLAQKLIGSTGKDVEGNYKDASVGRCAEIIAVSFLQDPNNSPEGEHVQATDSDQV